ncbi:MAG: AmmeMemoRadiSam system radical SAM enzyme [Deltaproteobacteria bacterium]|nr:AmmeMemoRadiSam system radical SAM enzyme [Deltaproteobacteria bacterium]
MTTTTSDAPVHDHYIGRWWHREADRIVCDLCPRACSLPKGKRGFCFVRQNIDDQLVLTTYGKSTGFCIDPIEKKPLNHFLPGTPILSFGTAGCNLGCKFCQNWDISKARQTEVLSDWASPDAIVAAALRSDCRSLAFTYNDPVVWAEYAIDCAIAARDAGLKTVAVTAGYVTREARPDVFRQIDAANVDLKAFTSRFYEDVTLSDLQPVLDTLRWLKHETDIWFEITNLMIPGENDSPDEIKRMVDWILENLGDQVPVHFTAFHPDYKMTDLPATPPATLQRARRQALDVGLKYVYVGNCHDTPGQSTYCPGCGELAIERDWYQLGRYEMRGNRCKRCDHIIAGVFEETPGSWGPRREPITIVDQNEDASLVHLRRSSARDARKQHEEQLSERNAKAALQRKNQDRVRTELTYSPKVDFTIDEQQQLLQFARQVTREVLGLSTERPTLPAPLCDAPAFGSFITLKRQGMLRSCRGRWGGDEPARMEQLIREVTTETVTFDPRFPSIRPEEFPFLSIEISLMHSPATLAGAADRAQRVRVGEHGLVVIHASGRGLLLPQVALEAGWNSEQFLSHTCEKAGIAKDAWKDPSCEIITFEAAHFSLDAELPELSYYDLSDQVLAELIKAANIVFHGEERDLQFPRSLVTNAPAEVGVQLIDSRGRRGTIVHPNTNVVAIVMHLAAALREQALKDKVDPKTLMIAQLSVLSVPIPLVPADFPDRLKVMGPGAIAARRDGVFSIHIPPHSERRNPILLTLAELNLSPRDWNEGRVSLSSYRVRTVSAAPQSRAAALVRTPAVAGSFYPAEVGQMREEIANLFAPYSGETQTPALAVMLPHAGWRFCGKIIAQTLAGVTIPHRVVIIGPKHTSLGPKWSAANHALWQIPGAQLPVARDFISALAARLPGLELETHAHEREHGAEVLLPFLAARGNNVQIAPIALGQASRDDIRLFAEALAAILDPVERARTLLIISSDMNHFASDQENRRRDRLALAAISSRNPQMLLDTCRAHDISMCGAIPAAIIMSTLAAVAPSYRVEMTGYATSGEVTGELDRVVGYAGARFYER